MPSDIHFDYMQGVCVMRMAKGKDNMYAQQCKFVLTPGKMSEREGAMGPGSLVKGVRVLHEGCSHGEGECMEVM